MTFSKSISALILFFNALLLMYPQTGRGQQNSFAVYFRPGSFVLSSKARGSIDSILQVKKFTAIILTGYCDEEGSEAYNDRLAAQRVSKVKTYLITRQVAAHLISTEVIGERNSASQLNSGRSRNRRVDIVFNAAKSGSASPRPTKKEVEISGQILDENKKPLVADITLSDPGGRELKVVTSGQDGRYAFKALLFTNVNYSLTYYNDSSFFELQKFNLSDPATSYKNIRTILPELKSGRKYPIKNLNFVGGKAQLIPASIPSLNALARLMKKNKSLVIRIEGHVNNPKSLPDQKTFILNKPIVMDHNYDTLANQQLSEARAQMVYDFLTEKGVARARMSTIGFGAKQMIYPDPQNESEHEQNRRVEIRVLSFETAKKKDDQ